MDSIYDNIRETLEASKERSAWGRGVNAYAVALVDRLENKSLLSVFRDPAGVPWYELPFCFTPYWENPAKYY